MARMAPGQALLAREQAVLPARYQRALPDERPQEVPRRCREQQQQQPDQNAPVALVFLGPDLHPCSVPLRFVGSNSNGAELGAVASGNPNEPWPARAVPRTTSQAGCSKSLEGPGLPPARRWNRAWYGYGSVPILGRLRNTHVVRRRAASLVSQASVKGLQLPLL